MILLFLCLCLSFSYEYTKYKTSGRIKLGITLESCSQGDYIIVKKKTRAQIAVGKLQRPQEREIMNFLPYWLLYGKCLKHDGSCICETHKIKTIKDTFGWGDENQEKLQRKDN